MKIYKVTYHNYYEEYYVCPNLQALEQSLDGKKPHKIEVISYIPFINIYTETK